MGGHKLLRQAKLKWVPVAKMQVSPVAQRDFRQARIDELAANFDPEQMGAPTVNIRTDGGVWIIDGQHRIEGYKGWMGDGKWEDQSIQCFVYEGLNEEEEADIFLKLNDTLQVTSFDRFRIAVTAGRPVETEIDRIVRANHLRISRNRTGIEVGSTRAVTTLMRIYKRSGPQGLAKTLRIAWNAYGQDGLESMVLDGLGLVVGRHADINEDEFARKLQHKLSITPLLSGAERYYTTQRASKANCVAASAVDIYNRKTPRRSEKLPLWWKGEGEDAE